MNRAIETPPPAGEPTHVVGKRRRAREMALQMLYQHDVGGSAAPQLFSSFDLSTYVAERGAAESKVLRQAFVYAQHLVTGTLEHREAIDELLRQQADHWRLERMSLVDRNILRLAVYEIMHEPEVPHLVALDEAIELAKLYGSDQSGRFVNGLLDGLLKSHDFPGSRT